MRKFLFFLLTLMVIQPAIAASYPVTALSDPASITTAPPLQISKKKEARNVKKANKPNILQKAKIKVLQFCQAKGFLIDGEMNDRQKRQAKWSLILGLSSIGLLLIPFVGLLAIPAAIIGLVLGIKSVEGNNNTQGIIGIIASGLTLLLLLIAIAVVATMFASWN